MTCPYCGSEEIELAPAASGGTPTARCAKCGADLDPAALATQVEAGRSRSRGARVAGGVAGVLLVGGLLLSLARPHSQPAGTPVRQTPRMSVPACDTVYVTRTGMKFHRPDCRYLRQGRDRMARDEAVSRGYSACSVCQP